MNRSLKAFPNETWYYYTFYNIYDDEKREYRFDRHSKQVERILAEPSHHDEQYLRSELDSSKQYESIQHENADTRKILSETLMDNEPYSETGAPPVGHNVITVLSLLDDQQLSRLLNFENYAIVQRVVNTSRKVYQEQANNHKLFRDVVKYSSCQYEKILCVLTSSSVATSMLLSNLILLVLILSSGSHDKNPI